MSEPIKLLTISEYNEIMKTIKELKEAVAILTEKVNEATE